MNGNATSRTKLKDPKKPEISLSKIDPDFSE
jgi:hypothetical protein